MTPSRAVAARPAGLPLPREAGSALPGLLFVAGFLFFWISITPFADRSDPAILVPSEGSNLLNQFVVSLLTLLVVWRASRTEPRLALSLLTGSGALMFAWFGVSALLSADPGLSIRRYVLTIMVFALAAGLLMMPRDVRDFARLLAICCGVVLVASYLGLVLLPDLAIHQASDLLEPEHDGSWRGVFSHKNGAGAAMALGVILGLFVKERYHRAIGWTIVLASTVFLAFSHAKTATQMIGPVLLLAWAVATVRSHALRGILVWGGLALTNLLTVGSVVIGPVRALIAAVMPDPTFTSRTFIWQYVFDRFWEHPLVGHGYGAFWGSAGVFFGEAQKGGGNTAPDAHNCYLDLLITTGAPGLILGVGYFVVQPLLDANRALDSGADRATTMLFLRIYLFGIFFGTLESYLLMNGGAMWITLLLAVLGLRLNATSSLRTGSVDGVAAGGAGR